MSENSECLANKEPLGYQHFLYDVNIEYNLGGHRAQSGSNCLSFKLKCLPYMINCNDHRWLPMARKSSLTSSESSTCDDSSSTIPQDYSLPSSTKMLLDVSQQTCAFLAKSECVPPQQLNTRRVVLEIISAKLSKPISATHNHPLERTRLVAPSLLSSDTSFRIPISPVRHRTNIVPPANNLPSPSSNKTFVNYTLLIKTVPGLDRQPAVIERRFSDFLFLYRGLKAKKCFAATLDKDVSFPRKVYMGNFSLHNIAERSLEFSKLLNLCMCNTGIMWSKSFVSFILDKELKEAHCLSLTGDLDELQALIETPHRIVKKLFLGSLHHPEPSMLPNSTNTYPNNNNTTNAEPNNTLINRSNSEASLQSATSSQFTLSQSACDTKDIGLYNYSHIRGVSPSLNERLLVIFCLLFFTYYQSENYTELKQTLREFMSLISSQTYLDSLAAPRHYTPLKACLIFLISLKEGCVIEENQRAWLAKKLEVLDNSHKNSSPIIDSSSHLRNSNYNSRTSSVDLMVKALRGFDWNLSSDTYDM